MMESHLRCQDWGKQARITHHVHILEMNADSFRLKQSRSRRRQPSE